MHLKLNINFDNNPSNITNVSGTLFKRRLYEVIRDLIFNLYEKGFPEDISVPYVQNKVLLILRKFNQRDELKSPSEKIILCEETIRKYAEYQGISDCLVDDFIANFGGLREFIILKCKDNPWFKESDKEKEKTFVFLNIEYEKYLDYINRRKQDPKYRRNVASSFEDALSMAEVYFPLLLFSIIISCLVCYPKRTDFRKYINNNFFYIYENFIALIGITGLTGYVEYPLEGCLYQDLLYELFNYVPKDNIAIPTVTKCSKKKSFEISIDNTKYFSEEYKKALHFSDAVISRDDEDFIKNLNGKHKHKAIIRFTEGSKPNTVKVNVIFRGWQVLARVIPLDVNTYFEEEEESKPKRFNIYNLWKHLGTDMKHLISNFVAYTLMQFEVKGQYKESYLTPFQYYVGNYKKKYKVSNNIPLDTLLIVTLALSNDDKNNKKIAQSLIKEYETGAKSCKKTILNNKKELNELFKKARKLRKDISCTGNSLVKDFIDELRRLYVY